MSGKLQEKGIIAIEQRENNKKEKFFRLTPKGEAVWADYLAQHAQSNRRLCAFFATLSPVSYTHLDVYKRQVPTYKAEDCPLCQDGKELTKRGSTGKSNPLK